MQSDCERYPVPRAGQGFVLVATLWVLVAITVGATYFADQVDKARELAREARNAARVLTEMESTRAEILFRLGTSDLSPYGLGSDPGNAIRLDDRPYRGTGADIVRLQDARGLVNLNFVDRVFLSRLLGEFGVPVERRDSLMDMLQDYIDTDDFRRLNGADTREYLAAGLPPPPNDWINSPYELQSIFGWRDERRLWDDKRFLQAVSASRVFGFNPNTAPIEALASLPGSNRDLAAAIIALRRSSPILSPEHLEGMAAGAKLGGVEIIVSPSASMRVTHQAAGVPWMIQYGLTFMPASNVAPWRVDYHVRSAAVTSPENETNVPALPARLATLPAVSETN